MRYGYRCSREGIYDLQYDETINCPEEEMTHDTLNFHQSKERKQEIVYFKDSNNYIGSLLYWLLSPEGHHTKLYWKLNEIKGDMGFDMLFSLPHGILYIPEENSIMIAKVDGVFYVDPASSQIRETLYRPKKDSTIMGCFFAGGSSEIVLSCLVLPKTKKNETVKPSYYGVKINLQKMCTEEFSVPELLLGACRTSRGDCYISGEQNLYRLDGTSLNREKEFSYDSAVVIGAWPNNQLVMLCKDPQGIRSIMWNDIVLPFGHEPIDILLYDTSLWIRRQNVLKLFTAEGHCIREHQTRAKICSFGRLNDRGIWVFCEDNSVVVYDDKGIQEEIQIEIW
jgi:hypothetical protein